METLLPKQTTAGDKMITPYKNLLVSQPIGGPHRDTVRSLSGESSGSWGASAALRLPVYALALGGSYTSSRSSM